MTDHKSWLWRRKSSDKTIAVADKEDPSSKTNDEEIHILLAEKAELERDLKDLNDKLSFALSECNANDKLAKKHAKTAQEALAGREKADAKALSLKEELNEALEQRSACEERISQLEAALKECMQQLRFVREEKEQRIQDVLAKAAKDYEEKRLVFEETMAESGKKIAVLEAEITELGEVLFLKEGLVEELNRQRAKMDGDMKELLAKVDSLEKQNTSLKYEVRVLEKEIDIRNEEREFNRRTADATHKQHLENVKKIAKLESECQRLRVLVRKRLPGPAALAKMRNEVEVLERGPNDTRRRATTPNRTGSSSQLDYVMEKLSVMEEENNVLREALEKKSSELQISKNMYARATLKLSQAETQVEDLSKAQMTLDLTRSPIILDVRGDDKASCAGSSDINLMDDFVEMEKLALVAVDKPFDSSPVSSNVMGSELVLVSSCEPGLSISISKLIQIIEGIDSRVLKNSASPTGYSIRVLQWKTSDLAAVIQGFLHICYDFLHGKVGFDRFAQEAASTLEWIVNHCFSIQDVSSMKDAIKKHFDRDETRSEGELEPTRSSYHGAIPLLQIQSDLKEEIAGLKDEMTKLESAKNEVEEKLGAQLKNQKLENDDLNTRLSDAREKISSVEVELENKAKKCEELEATCLQLEIQLDSVTTKDVEEAANTDQYEKQLQTNWEITAASEKLAQCQETIFNLGKQLKAMATPQDTAILDKVISSPTKTPLPPTEKGTNPRCSLLDKMLEDDDGSPKTKEIICTSEPLKPPPGFQRGSANPAFESDLRRRSFGESGFGPLAIVPSKKQSGGGLFKKLLWRKKRSSNNKLALPFATT